MFEVYSSVSCTHNDYLNIGTTFCIGLVSNPSTILPSPSTGMKYIILENVHGHIIILQKSNMLFMFETAIVVSSTETVDVSSPGK